MEDQDLQKQINEDIQTNLQNHRADIKELYEHSKIANEEMGVIKTDMGIMKNDVKWIKDTFSKFEESIEKSVDKMDSRGWWILGTVVIGIAAQILITLLNK